MADVIRLPVAWEGPEELLHRERPVSKKTVAELFGVATRTVDRWVDRGMPNGSCWIRIGAHRRFYVTAIAAWLDSGS